MASDRRSAVSARICGAQARRQGFLRGQDRQLRRPSNANGPSICLQPLEALEIIRNAALQIVLRRVTELVARARNIVDAGSGIGHAEEIQPGSDLDVGVRQILADDARDIERDAYAGAD